MVHHIVMWKFKPEIQDAEKPTLKKAMAENLKSLVGKVPGLLTVEFVEEPLSIVVQLSRQKSKVFIMN